MSESSEVKLTMREILINYLSKDNKPFHIEPLIDRMIDEGVIDKSDKEVALNAYYDLYDERLIVLYGGIAGVTELVAIYVFDVKKEIMNYLKQKGARVKVRDLIQDLMAARGFDESAIEVSLVKLIDEGELTCDRENEQIFIPRES